MFGYGDIRRGAQAAVGHNHHVIHHQREVVVVVGVVDFAFRHLEGGVEAGAVVVGQRHMELFGSVVVVVFVAVGVYRIDHREAAGACWVGHHTYIEHYGFVFALGAVVVIG